MKIQKLVLGAVAILLGGHAYGIQLLNNPGFETGLFAPWSNDNSVQSGSWAVLNSPSDGTASTCHTGNYCVSVGADVGLVQSVTPIATGSITGASFWVDPTNAVAVTLLYQGGGVTNYIFNPTGGQMNAWDQVDLMSQLNPSAILVGIEVFGYSGSTTKVDDVSILGTVPEPGAFWLLAAGLGTLGTLAQRKRNVRNRS